MTRKIFISLPVTDLAASSALYRALGFQPNPAFSDETATGPAYAIDDQTALQVVDGTVTVVSEGHWRHFGG